MNMKKFVKMAFVAMSLIAFSCDKYDDSELREAVNKLNDKVAALEAKVADNVSALQSMVSLGSVQSCKFDAEKGKALITLLDGTNLSIDLTVEGCSLLSVIEVSGEYYWGVCANGTTTQLLVGGKPVPVAVTPALKISESNEWMISVDGGKTWVSTGIFNEQQSADSGESTTSFFQDVKKEGDNLVLTLMDGTVIKVDIVGEAQFEAAQTALYFAKEGIEKSVALNTMNLKAYTVTEKPEGWKARVEHNTDEESYTLFITSPSDITAAAKSGTVKLLGTFTGGQNPEIVSVDVTFEEAFKLSRGTGYSVNVAVAEHAFEDITGYIVGAVKTTDFSAEAVAAWLNTEEGYLSEYHEGAKSFELESLLDVYDPTEAYVVYAVEQIPVKLILSGADSYTAADLQTVEIGSSKAKAGISNVKYDSAYLSLEFSGMSGYYGGYADLAFWESMGRDNVLESLNVGNMEPMTAMSYEGYVSMFPDGIEGTQILPATDYIVWIMPYSDKEGYQYVADNFITYSFTSAPVVEDNTVAAPACEIKDVTYGGFTAKITPASGAYKTYAAIRKTSAVAEDLVQSVIELIDVNEYSMGTSELTVSANSFSDTDEVCIMAVSLTEDGRFGKVYKQIVPLKTLSYSDDMTVSASSSIHGLGDVTVSFSFTGSPSTISYYCTASSYFGDEVLQDMLARGQIGDAVFNYDINKLEGGNKLEITGLTIGIEYTFYALVKDSAGVPSKMSKVTFTPIVLIDYVASTSSNYKYGMPVISGTKSGSNYTLQVTKPAECVKYWLFIGDLEYMTGSSTVINITDEYGATDKLVTMQLKEVGALELEDSYSTVYEALRATTRLYVSWLDDIGNYHMVSTLNPNK